VDRHVAGEGVGRGEDEHAAARLGERARAAADIGADRQGIGGGGAAVDDDDGFRGGAQRVEWGRAADGGSSERVVHEDAAGIEGQDAIERQDHAGGSRGELQRIDGLGGRGGGAAGGEVVVGGGHAAGGDEGRVGRGDHLVAAIEGG